MWKKTNILCALIALTLPCFGQGYYYAAAGGSSCTVTTNAIGITLLTSYGDTSNATSHATASVSPAADSTLILFAAYSPVGTEVVTNTGTLQLSWLPLTNVSFNTIASPAHELVCYVSQMPPGVSSFAMKVVLSGVSYTGANMHLIQVTGADTNLLWGQNAIVQVAQTRSNAVANPQITIAAPNASGSNAVLIAVADDLNATTDNAAGTGQTELGETAYNTPAAGLATYYLTNAQSSQTLYTHTATARDLAMVAIEIRAGTNACGSGEAPFPAYGITRYVHTGVVGGTQNTVGGDGTTTNLTGATRAFNSLREAILTSFPTSPTVLAVPWKFVMMGNYADTGVCDQIIWDHVGTVYTNYLWVEAHPDWRHDGKWNTAKYHASITNENWIYSNGVSTTNYNASHVRFGYLQGEIVSSDGADHNVFRFSTLNVTNAGGVNAADLRGYNLIAKATITAGANNVACYRNSPFNGNATGTADEQIPTGKTRLINCLAIGGESGFEQDKTDVMLVNCGAYANANNYNAACITINCWSAAHTGIAGFLAVGTGGGLSRNNRGDSAEGYHSSTSEGFSFVNAAGLDFHLQAGDTAARNLGFIFPLNTLFDFDNDGQTRPNTVGAWDVGPDEQQ